MERRRLASYLIVMLMLQMIFWGLPLKVGATGGVDNRVYVATPSNAAQDENKVHIATSSDAIEMDDLTNVGIIDGLEEIGEVSDMVAVKVPALIKMESHSNSVNFEIVVTGNLESDSFLNICSDKQFVLESLFKEPITGAVSQDKEIIEATDIEEGQAVINGNIQLDKNVTAGEWKGSFEVQVYLNSPTIETLEWELLQREEEILEEDAVEIATPSNAKPNKNTETDETEEVEDETEEVEDETADLEKVPVEEESSTESETDADYEGAEEETAESEEETDDIESSPVEEEDETESLESDADINNEETDSTEDNDTEEVVENSPEVKDEPEEKEESVDSNEAT